MQYASVCYQFAVPFYFSKPQPVCSPFPLQKATSLQSFSASESHKFAVLFCFRKPQVCSPFLLQKATSLQSFSASESHKFAVLFCFRKPQVCSPFLLQKATSLQSFSTSESHKSAVLFCFKCHQSAAFFPSLCMHLLTATLFFGCCTPVPHPHPPTI